MSIFGLSAFDDNYIWCLQDASDSKNTSQSQHNLWVVDPGDAQPVLDWLQQKNAALAGILLTHHHWDHTQGVSSLVEKYPHCEVIASAKTQAQCPDLPIRFTVQAGDKVPAGGRIFEVIETPGHTLDHIAFFSHNNGHPILFCGDTLFTAGCGRVFEGTAQQMTDSLLRLRALPDDTLIYCGHEYTCANINFAAIAEPQNPAIKQRQQDVIQRTRAQLPCVPERLAVEKATNPFLRFDTSPLKETLQRRMAKNLAESHPESDNAQLFATVRAWKDQLDQTGELETC